MMRVNSAAGSAASNRLGVLERISDTETSCSLEFLLMATYTDRTGADVLSRTYGPASLVGARRRIGLRRVAHGFHRGPAAPARPAWRAMLRGSSDAGVQ